MRCDRALIGLAILMLASAPGCSTSSKIVTSRRFSQVSDSTFSVGAASILEIDNFSGTVGVIPGNPGVMSVAAEKWAGQPVFLDQVELEMVQLQDTVRIRSANPSALSGVSVDIHATVPPDARPAIRAGSGNLVYEGRPQGECGFVVGAGDITLRLPSDVNVELHLVVGSGVIQLGFPVVGQVGIQVVDGIIGTGADGMITAQVGAGRIFVLPQ